MASGYDENKKLSCVTDKVKRLKSCYDQKGLLGVAQHLKQQLNEWRGVGLKVAVTGRSGVGKSAFVNSIRGITADDIEYNPAAVGVKECTKSVNEYAYPGNENFRLYDLPGLGTPNFRRETYLEDVKFDLYDFFIILSETRFTDDDLWLAREVKNRGKLFYFVRSKVSNAVLDDKKAHPRSHSDEMVLSTIREDLMNNLKFFPRKRLFLIDNYDTHLYDFGALTLQLIQDSNEIKQETLAFSLACLSKEVLEEKRRKLKRRIPLVAYMVGCFASLEELKFSYDPLLTCTLVEEISFYRKQFGIDSKSLILEADVCNLSADLLQTIDQMQSEVKPLSESLKEELSHVINFIPVVGNIVLGVKSAKFLEKQLDIIAENALKIHGFLTDGLAKKYVP